MEYRKQKKKEHHASTAYKKEGKKRRPSTTYLTGASSMDDVARDGLECRDTFAADGDRQHVALGRKITSKTITIVNRVITAILE